MRTLINKIIDINLDILSVNYEGLVPLHYFLIKNKFQKPTILHFRSSVVRNNFLYRIYARHINKYINYLIFITENQLKEAKKAGVLLKKNHSVLYNASYQSIDYTEKKFLEKNLNILYLGNIDKSRGVDRLLEIAEICKKEKLNIRIDIYGQQVFKKKFF